MFRIAFVGAREGHFPVAVSLINYKRFTPIPALLLGVCTNIYYLLFIIYLLFIYYSYDHDIHTSMLQ